LWFHEGLCELIHGAKERLFGVLTYTDPLDLFNYLTIPTYAQGFDSRGYAAGYVAVAWLHQLTKPTGIRSVIELLLNGQSLNQAIAATTSYANTTAFVNAVKGAPGRAYLNSLLPKLSLNSDTGAIGGWLIDGGSILNDEQVIGDT